MLTLDHRRELSDALRWMHAARASMIGAAENHSGGDTDKLEHAGNAALRAAANVAALRSYVDFFYEMASA
jgi:hypothetical protein